MKLKKKTIKSRTKAKSTKKRKMYFGKEAHQAVVDYQNESSRENKNKIYIDRIKPSFEKLSENLIFIHGFANDAQTFHILKSDCVSFLFETLEKFDTSRGSKAFSYFNVCAKNFLIIKSKKTQKNNQRHVSLDDFKNLNKTEKHAIENYKIIPAQEDILINIEDKEILKEILLKIKNRPLNSNESLCIDAIITLFGKIEDLDFLNKRAIFVYLREISGLNPKQLSVSMSNIRKHYRDIIKNNDYYYLFKQ